jgi:hypothetical protein
MSVDQVLSSLGVPESAASNGTSIGLHNVAQLRDLLDIGLPAEQRAQHADALVGGGTAPGGTAPGGQPGVSLTQRLIQSVVGNDELSAEDQAQLAPAFPITAHVTAQTADAPPMQVNYVWDVSTADGTIKVISLLNGIELQAGGCIVARATPLHFSCTSFTRTGGPPPGYSGDFNILGRPGGPVPIPLTPTTPGQAAAGAPGQCTSAGIAGDGGGNGTPGLQGTKGDPGVRGNDGIASAIATIAITDSMNVAGATSKLLVVMTQSGPGGPGGTGGQGATGQQGGNGGDGANCECTGNGGGSAGAGGRGGSGGAAGDGGNGVDAAGDIALYLPKGVSTKLLQFVPIPALPGPAGNPGLGGNGGAPGKAGAAGKNNSAGGSASSGPTGNPGGAAPGISGTHTGKPAQLNPSNLSGAAG